MQTIQVSDGVYNFVKHISNGMGWTDSEVIARTIEIVKELIEKEEKEAESE